MHCKGRRGADLTPRQGVRHFPSPGQSRPELSQAGRGSPTYTETGCCRARRRAFRSVGRAARANETSEDFVVSAANAIGTGDHANCRSRPGVALRACRSCRARRASGALRAGRSAIAGGADWALVTGFALRTLRSDRSGRSRRTSWSPLPDRALGTHGSLLALCALGTCWTNRARRASVTRRPWRTLRSWRRGARRQRDDRDGSRNDHQLSHQPLPVRGGRDDDARAAARKLTKRRTTVVQVRFAGLPQSTST
jgi:hypothetical protein